MSPASLRRAQGVNPAKDNETFIPWSHYIHDHYEPYTNVYQASFFTGRLKLCCQAALKNQQNTCL